MLSHPQPELPPPKKPPPNPHPQPSLLSPPLQQLSRIRIQRIELHPQPPDLLLLPQPQFVAVKSLIVLPPKKFNTSGRLFRSAGCAEARISHMILQAGLMPEQAAYFLAEIFGIS